MSLNLRHDHQNCWQYIQKDFKSKTRKETLQERFDEFPAYHFQLALMRILKQYTKFQNTILLFDK